MGCFINVVLIFPLIINLKISNTKKKIIIGSVGKDKPKPPPMSLICMESGTNPAMRMVNPSGYVNAIHAAINKRGKTDISGIPNINPSTGMSPIKDPITTNTMGLICELSFSKRADN